MKQARLQFPVAEDLWNFLAATRKAHVEAEDVTADGWFTDDEVQLATGRFGAEVLPYTPPTASPAPAVTLVPREAVPFPNAAPTHEPAPPDRGQPVELYGKSGRVYPGTIYTKASSSTVTAPALICLANSSRDGGTWRHRVNAIYATDNAEQERLRFSERDDVSHLIVVPGEACSGVDATDDLIHSYLHG